MSVGTVSDYTVRLIVLAKFDKFAILGGVVVGIAQLQVYSP